jgi:hypothetical protein
MFTKTETENAQHYDAMAYDHTPSAEDARSTYEGFLEETKEFLKFIHYQCPNYPHERLNVMADCFTEDLRYNEDLSRAEGVLDIALFEEAEDFALALEKLPRKMTEEQLIERYGSWKIV